MVSFCIMLVLWVITSLVGSSLCTCDIMYSAILVFHVNPRAIFSDFIFLIYIHGISILVLFSNIFSTIIFSPKIQIFIAISVFNK